MLLLSFVVQWVSLGQDSDSEEFENLSLKYRTTLHYDPLLETSLDALVRLYRNQDRNEELIGLYRSHIEQYPDDAGAKTVLILILKKVDRGGADELLASAVPLHPDFAPLQYVLYQFLTERGDARAAEALSKAIDLEPNSARRNDWLDELLSLSESEDVRVLAEKHLKELLAVENLSSDELLSLGKMMQRYAFYSLSIQALQKVAALDPAPEAAVETEVLLAKAEGALGEEKNAGARLDALLAKLAPDHWRRREILSQRVSVLADDAERAAMLKSLENAFKENPSSESRILDYAELLVASERNEEAAELLVSSAGVLPASASIESRAFELLDAGGNLALSEKFLMERLELSPERSDLRFRLVKVLYARGDDAAAEQDFQAVVAGLEPKEASARILELQRYLRVIDRIDAAAIYLERYLKKHPDRLDVAGELAEIFLEQDNVDAVYGLVGAVDTAKAEVENVIDFAQLLIAAELPAAAKQVLDEKAEVEPKQFDLGLLLIDVESELGESPLVKRRIEEVRELADSPARYAKWLDASVTANTRIESLPGFFASEQQRFSFSGEDWSRDKVERFLLLCEVGKQRLFTDKVAEAIRDQLSQPSLDSALKVRLRRFLVGVLENSPNTLDEIEAQLNQLVVEDSEREVEYELRKALAYHKNSRIDLSQKILAEMNLQEVGDADFLREAVEVLIDYQFYEEAETALAAINEIDAQDLFSWEKRLSLLAGLKKETQFRSVIRSLRAGDAGFSLRETTADSLRKHLFASYFRSVSRLTLPENYGRMDEILPLLTAMDREEKDPESGLWVAWCRAFVLTRLQRVEEATEALETFRELAEQSEQEEIRFPDGLSLSVAAAESVLPSAAPRNVEEEAASISFLLGKVDLDWAFEVDPGTKIVQTGVAGDQFLILDDRGSLYSVNRETGKLSWQKKYRDGSSRREARATSWFGFAGDRAMHGSTGEDIFAAKAPRPFSVNGSQFFLLHEGRMLASDANTGELNWAAEMPFQPVSGIAAATSTSNANPVFDVSAKHAVVFQPMTGEVACFDSVSGKLLWLLSPEEIEPEAATRTFSLNSGVSVSGGKAFVYGGDATILDLEKGEVIWRLTGSSPATFPIAIREDHQRGAADLVSAEEVVDPVVQMLKDIQVIDFSAPAGELGIASSSFSSPPSSLVSPAVYWARSEEKSKMHAFATLRENELRLMKDGSTRRIAIDLPISTQSLPARGSLIGDVGGHSWFVDGNSLFHSNFYRYEVSELPMDRLGFDIPLRTALHGNQIVVRGRGGYSVINARTGRVLGQMTWSKSVLEYLNFHGLLSVNDDKTTNIWRGRLLQNDNGEPTYCFPIHDIVHDGQYFTSFGQRSLLCLRKADFTVKETSAQVAP